MYDNYCCRDEKEREKAASVLVPVAVGLTSGAFRLAVLSISNFQGVSEELLKVKHAGLDLYST